MKKYNLKRLSDLRIVHTVQNLSVKMQCDILSPINKSHTVTVTAAGKKKVCTEPPKQATMLTLL